MRIETGSRLHFGLIDLSSKSSRVDGGIGLGIKYPGVTLEVEESTCLKVHGPMRERVKNTAEAVIDRYNLQPVEITIKETIPQHRGLGSGTQTDLAAGFAVARTNNLELSTSEVAEVVGRGGTSGIGTAVFEKGGFVLDGGHDLNEKGGFLPSAASSVSPPPVISRLDFPDWNIKILIPGSTGAYGSDEVSVFNNECPIPLSEVQELSHIILMQLLPSVAEPDFGLFRDSIKQIQEIGFKKRELQRQPDSLYMIEELQNRGYAAGMSSLGPAVFAISPDPISVPYDDIKTIETRAMNRGAKFS
jgi:beta-ribofuranosylaminobenzene 5'-phosphate synthase